MSVRLIPFAAVLVVSPICAHAQEAPSNFWVQESSKVNSSDNIANGKRYSAKPSHALDIRPQAQVEGEKLLQIAEQ